MVARDLEEPCPESRRIRERSDAPVDVHPYVLLDIVRDGASHEPDEVSMRLLSEEPEEIRKGLIIPDLGS